MDFVAMSVPRIESFLLSRHINKSNNFDSIWMPTIWDKVVLSKIVLSNFCPKQPNESIGGPRASIFELFIVILTWPKLTRLNMPLSPFFHPLTLPG